MILHARFDDTVEPRLKELTLNGQRLAWHLTFIDAVGTLYFTDVSPDVGTPTNVLYSSDVGHVELRLNAPVPLNAPVAVTLSKDGATLFDASLEAKVAKSASGRHVPGRLHRVGVEPEGRARESGVTEPIPWTGSAGRKARAFRFRRCISRTGSL